jgi:hypothetical protein
MRGSKTETPSSGRSTGWTAPDKTLAEKALEVMIVEAQRYSSLNGSAQPFNNLTLENILTT